MSLASTVEHEGGSGKLDCNCRALLFFCFFAALEFAPFAPNAFGQISTASINGTVRDATGAVVPDATILLTNVNTGVQKRTVSNEAGVYVILSILTGTYTLEASKPGFNTNKLAPFTLAVNQTATLDFTLAVGTVAQTINVEAVGTAI